MLEQLVNRLAGLGVEAKRNIIIAPPAEPVHVYGVVNTDTGAVDWRRASPAPLNATALAVSGLVRALKAHVGDEVNGPAGATVWYSRGGVVGIANRGDRRDRVTLPLKYSPQMQLLSEWDKGGASDDFKQAELVYLLRTTFKNNMDKQGRLLDIVRKIRWESDGAAEVEILHGKSSVGKQLRQEARGLDAIPEYTTFTVPVFDSAELSAKTFPVECAFEPDAASSTFSIIPLPGEVERAKAFAEAEVAALIMASLTEEGLGLVPVLYGHPG
jgi:hypothetical protein